MKLAISWCVLCTLFVLSYNPLNGQSNANTLNHDPIVVKLVEKTNGLSHFYFSLTSDYKEDLTMQQVRRFEKITQSSITVKYKGHKVVVGIDQSKFTEEQLRSFISGLTVTHGYLNHTLIKK